MTIPSKTEFIKLQVEDIKNYSNRGLVKYWSIQATILMLRSVFWNEDDVVLILTAQINRLINNVLTNVIEKDRAKTTADQLVSSVITVLNGDKTGPIIDNYDDVSFEKYKRKLMEEEAAWFKALKLSLRWEMLYEDLVDMKKTNTEWIDTKLFPFIEDIKRKVDDSSRIDHFDNIISQITSIRNQWLDSKHLFTAFWGIYPNKTKEDLIDMLKVRWEQYDK